MANRKLIEVTDDGNLYSEEGPDGLIFFYCVDGLKVERDTGEILGPEDEAFQIDSTERAEWFLKKRMNLENELASIERERKALNDNLDKRASGARSALFGLNRIFEPQLVEFARVRLEGQKSRTWTNTYGNVSFTTVPPALIVDDQEKAASWAESNAPEAVKKKTDISFSIKAFKEKYPDTYDSLLKGECEKDAQTGLAIKPKSVTVKVTTGIG